jgi:tetratricopeptide (TPR) repeat protein
LFLQEIVSFLIDDGHLHEQEGRWEPTDDLTAVPLAPTVRALLEARVDRLPPQERDVLAAAAIVGREFRDEDLEVLLPDVDAARFNAALDTLCRRDLVELQRLSRPGSRQFAFGHVLVRDVVYRSLSKEVRSRDHERYGRALIEMAKGRLAEVQEIVGYHLESAFHLREALLADPHELQGLGDEASRHLAAAGRRAFGRDDLAAAASLFGRALRCRRRSDGEWCEMARLQSGALFDLGRFEEAEEVVARALAVAERIGDEALRWRLELEQRNLGAYLRPLDNSAADLRAFAEEAVDTLRTLDDTTGLARAQRLLGEALLLLGRQEEANEAFLEGWKLAERSKDERELAFRPEVAGLHGPTPLPTFIEQCERVLIEAPRPRPETLMRLALATALVGREEEANARIEQGLARARDVGGAFRVADAELHAGAALLYLGDLEPAVSLLSSATERLGALGEVSVRSTALALLGEAHFRLGHLDEALSAAESCREIAAEDDQASQIGWRQVSAKVAAARGRRDEALQLAREATSIADSTDFLTMAAFAHLDAAQVLADVNDPDGSREEHDIALTLFEQKGVAGLVVSVGWPTLKS